MFTKESLRKEFLKDWKEHYQIELFKQKGFHRKVCRSCKRHFWTLDEKRTDCGDPPCQKYEFIGKPVAKARLDYIQLWKEFEKFFVKNGHESIPRYPVIDRWRPDLFFTMASIQDFQRIDQGNMTFEYPASQLVVPQMCLRFNDIPNVGVTGRHHTSFIMSGQHSFGGYWKDKCIELNFRFLTEVLKIPEKELTYKEDLWAMPDFSAFGPSIETFSRGLELVNSVFMQFTKSGSSYKELPMKVIDVGWGHERLVWFTQGTPTGYDAVFGPVVSWMKKQTGFHENDLFKRYAAYAGELNIDEIESLEKVRKHVARQLGVPVQKLINVIEPMQALYAIADHARTLLFAISDSGIPSNVGGGYNLRILLRRALSFIKEFEFPFSLQKIAELHAGHLYSLFPELTASLDRFSRIMEIEKKRYEITTEKATSIVQRLLQKEGKIPEEKLIKLYTSNGISPELVEKIAKKQGVPFEIPGDFYVKLTGQHMSGRKTDEEKEEIKINTASLPPTRLLYYESPEKTEFEAKVLKQSGDWIVLDKTLFYPEGGGQPGDLGQIFAGSKTYPVKSVKKIGEIVLHKVSVPKNANIVRGKIDWDRRMQLMRMHTATHVIAGSARKIIGSHLWQAGAQKGLESSRIDLSHYQAFSKEEIRKTEALANRMIIENHPVESKFMDRSVAEKKYGFTLYQGGASPGKQIRVVNIANGFDVEGCGGTHLSRTKDIDLIKIIKSERIQDGVNRIEFTCGKPAYDFVDSMEKIALDTIRNAKSLEVFSPVAGSLHLSGDLSFDVSDAAEVFTVETKALPKTMERFAREIYQFHKELNKERNTAGFAEKTLEREISSVHRPVKNLKDLSELVFETWKHLRKELERIRKNAAENKAEKLLSKAKNNRITEVISGSRKDMIETAKSLISKKPELTVILANELGEIIGASNTIDVSKEIKKLCEKSGGAGGGRHDFAQGKADLSKLLKIFGKKLNFL